MAVELDCMIPLPQAAKQMGMTVAALTHLVTSGKLRAMKTPSGEVVVPESETKTMIAKEQFKHLHGKPITISAASAKYGVNVQTIYGWIRHGYIEKVKDEASLYPVKIDEVDIAYCAAVYKAQGGSRGHRIFDKHGQPYMLKRPEVAEYRRQKKTEPLPSTTTTHQGKRGSGRNGKSRT